MATPTYATSLADIDLAEGAVAYTKIGTQGGTVNAQETDFPIQGTYCQSLNTSAQWKSNAYGGLVYNAGSGKTIPSPGALLIWIYWWGPGVLATDANDGAGIVIGSASTAYYNWGVAGSDTWRFAGWRCYAIDPATTGTNTPNPGRKVGSPTTTLQYFGWEALVASATAIAKGAPFGIDAMRYGRCDLICTNGQSGAYASFGGNGTDSGAAAYDNDNTRRWGMCIPRDGAFYLQGLFQMGSASTAVDFRDSNRSVFIQDTRWCVANFNVFQVLNASSNIAWTNIAVKALGTASKGQFTVTDNATVALTSCIFNGLDTFAFLANTTASRCTFLGCGQITAAGATMTNSTVSGYTGAANTSAVVWNVNTDTDGKLDNMVFEKGTNAHHAIELGTSSPTTVTVRGITFTGFNAANGQNDSSIHVKRTTGTVTINVVGCAGNVTYKTEGATVSLSVNPVTLAIHAQDAKTSANVVGARVFVKVTSSAGGKPYQASVTITHAGATATVAHTGHGMASNDYVEIAGADQDPYNGAFQITKINDNSYSYTMTSDPGVDASGTITATFVVIDKDTDASGNATASYSWLADQPVTGRVRKMASTPYYQEGPISGTIKSASGWSTTVSLAKDE